MAENPKELTVPDAAAWRAWLEGNHAREAGVWLTLARKGVVEPTSLTYAQALDEALCFGWIDATARGGDGATYRQRFTPRRRRSPWSKRNVGIVQRLIDEGRMHAGGLAAVAAAKADGRWDAAYAGSATIEVPADLGAALDAHPAARDTFAGLSSQNRFAILYRIGGVKRAQTRERKIAEYVAMLARGETIYPQRPRS